MSDLQVNVELKHLWPEVPTAINSTPQQVCTATYSGDQQSCAAESAPAPLPTIPNAGVFSRKQIKEGEVLAVIPAKLSYRVQPGLEKLVCVLVLAAAMPSRQSLC